MFTEPCRTLGQLGGSSLAGSSLVGPAWWVQLGGSSLVGPAWWGIAAQIGYKRRPGRYGGKPAVVAGNTLDRKFEVDTPDRVWVTDITYIKSHEGWSYLSVVIDLFSRRVVGWSYAITHDYRPGIASAIECCLAAQAKDQGDDPLRSGITVYQQRVAIVPQQTQSDRQHEQTWELPRQCCRREPLPTFATQSAISGYQVVRYCNKEAGGILNQKSVNTQQPTSLDYTSSDSFEPRQIMDTHWLYWGTWRP